MNFFKRATAAAWWCCVAAVTVISCAKQSGGGSEQDLILQKEEKFRRAKLSNDTGALQELVADAYTGLNHNGRRRDRDQMLKLFGSYKINDISAADEPRIGLAGDAAVVSGAERERLCDPAHVSPCKADELLYLRTWVKREGQWRLLSNVQFKRPEQ
jgi:hypothetical protein